MELWPFETSEVHKIRAARSIGGKILSQSIIFDNDIGTFEAKILATGNVVKFTSLTILPAEVITSLILGRKVSIVDFEPILLSLLAGGWEMKTIRDSFPPSILSLFQNSLPEDERELEFMLRNLWLPKIRKIIQSESRQLAVANEKLSRLKGSLKWDESFPSTTIKSSAEQFKVDFGARSRLDVFLSEMTPTEKIPILLFCEDGRRAAQRELFQIHRDFFESQLDPPPIIPFSPAPELLPFSIEAPRIYARTITPLPILSHLPPLESVQGQFLPGYIGGIAESGKLFYVDENSLCKGVSESLLRSVFGSVSISKGSEVEIRGSIKVPVAVDQDILFVLSLIDYHMSRFVLVDESLRRYADRRRSFTLFKFEMPEYGNVNFKRSLVDNEFVFKASNRIVLNIFSNFMVMFFTNVYPEVKGQISEFLKQKQTQKFTEPRDVDDEGAEESTEKEEEEGAEESTEREEEKEEHQEREEEREEHQERKEKKGMTLIQDKIRLLRNIVGSKIPKNYAVKCQCPVQPIILNEDDISSWQTPDHPILKFENESFICASEKFKIPAVKRDSGFPCCFVNVPKEKKEPTAASAGYVLSKFTPLAAGRMGFLPRIVDEVLSVITNKKELKRIGAGGGLLNAILFALNRKDQPNSIRLNPNSCAQELYDLVPFTRKNSKFGRQERLQNRVLHSPVSYSTHVRALEDFFGIQLFSVTDLFLELPRAAFAHFIPQDPALFSRPVVIVAHHVDKDVYEPVVSIENGKRTSIFPPQVGVLLSEIQKREATALPSLAPIPFPREKDSFLPQYQHVDLMGKLRGIRYKRSGDISVLRILDSPSIPIPNLPIYLEDSIMTPKVEINHSYSEDTVSIVKKEFPEGILVPPIRAILSSKQQQERATNDLEKTIYENIIAQHLVYTFAGDVTSGEFTPGNWWERRISQPSSSSISLPLRPPFMSVTPRRDFFGSDGRINLDFFTGDPSFSLFLKSFLENEISASRVKVRSEIFFPLSILFNDDSFFTSLNQVYLLQEYLETKRELSTIEVRGGFPREEDIPF